MEHRNTIVAAALIALGAWTMGCSGQANTAAAEPNQVNPNPQPKPPPEPPQPNPQPRPGPTNTGDPGPDSAPPAK